MAWSISGTGNGSLIENIPSTDKEAASIVKELTNVTNDIMSTIQGYTDLIGSGLAETNTFDFLIKLEDYRKANEVNTGEISNGNEILIQMLKEDGLEFLRPGQEVLSLQENVKFMGNLEKIHSTYEFHKITKRMYGNFISFYIMNTPRGYRMQFVYNPENVELGGEVEAINTQWDFRKIQNE